MKLPEIPHSWAKATVTDQQGANELIPALLQRVAVKRVLIVCPMRGPVDLSNLDAHLCSTASKNALTGELYIPGNCGESSQTFRGTKLDWVICAGGTNPMHPDWVRNLRDQCKNAGVPFWFAGWGEWATSSYNMLTGLPSFRMFQSFEHYCNKAPTWMCKGDKLICPDGHIPSHGGTKGKTYPMCIVSHLGEDSSGRLLDGEEYSQVPG